MKKYILGTLGKDVSDPTCSMLAAQKIKVKDAIIGYSTFEEAIADLKCKMVQEVLIPAAYPNIRTFLMDEQLKVKKIFVFDIPDLVLVTEKELDEYRTIFLHPATESLLDFVTIKFKTKNFVNSNSIACEMVLKNKECCAITNRSCAVSYNLEILEVLRKSIHMPFMVFGENK